jgi:hypothetical protein
LVAVFANTSSLGGAIAVMIVFSLFVQAAEGSTTALCHMSTLASTGSVLFMSVPVEALLLSDSVARFRQLA